MNRALWILLPILFACEYEQRSVQSPAPPPIQLSATAEPVAALSLPHEYQVRIHWDRVASLGYVLAKYDEHDQHQRLTGIEAPKGVFLDRKVKEGTTVRYALLKDGPGVGAETSTVIPRDFDTKELPEITGPVNISGYDRVFLGLLHSKYPLAIRTRVLIGSANTGGLISTRIVAKNEEGKPGADGQPIHVITDELHGSVLVDTTGQPGGDGKKNETGEYVITPGQSGKGGAVNFTVTKGGNYWLDIVAMLARSSDENYNGKCGSMYVNLPNEKPFWTNCLGISVGWDGMYSLQGEQWYFAPGFFASRFRTPNPETPYKLVPWASPAWIGSTFRFRSQGKNAPIERSWGQVMAKETAWANRTAENDIPEGELRKFWALSNEISSLNEALQPYGLQVGVGIDKDAELKPETWASIPHIQKIREALPELAPLLKQRKQTVLYFRFWGHDQSVKLVKDYAIYLTGVPELSPDELVEMLKSDSIPRGEP